jgi:predicted P-loop ATPase
MRRKEPFTILSFENRYKYTGLINTISYEVMVHSFAKNYRRTEETVLEYQKGTKEFRDNAKDKGAFLMGTSIENRRDNLAIISRNMLTLDLDYCPSNIFEILQKKADEELDFRFFVYTTHSHTRDKPRLRLIVPLLNDIKPEEYEATASRLCMKIGIEFFDATTIQANRIMYFPNVSLDGEYICKSYNDDKGDLDAEILLKEYLDYHNIDEWQRPHFFEGKRRDRIEKGTIPDSTKTKWRMVNSFNIEYSITDAIDKFLSDIYKKERGDRYTYIDGESKNGLHILNPQYAYSHHGTDPAQGKLLNAFDIVRIHKFGKQDTNKTENEIYDDYGNMTSFQAMCDFIKTMPNVMKHDPKVKEQEEQFKEKMEELGIVVKEEHELSLMDLLERNTKDNTIKKSPNNITLIVKHDPAFKDLFFYDVIKQQICFEKAPYWDEDIKKGDGVRDLDFSFISIHLASPPYYQSGKDAMENAVVASAYERRINYPKDFLESLPEWDKKKRVETILIDLFDVGDCSFIREATKKWFTALIARIFEPGCKFDYAIAMIGAVGIGKSMFCKSLIAVDWDGNMENVERANYFFTDKEIDLRNERDTIDALRGACIVELAEFDKYFTKYDKATLKSFMTKTKDRFIERYGKRSIDVPRSFIFWATTNEMRPIKNVEDERRFMPFYSNLPKHKALIFDNKLWNKDIRDQVLAEAIYYYKSGYSYSAPFNPKQQREWDMLLERASLENDYFGIVEDYINNKFPLGFNEMAFPNQKLWWREGSGEFAREKRTEFCVKEIYCIALDKRLGDMPEYYIRKDIEQALGRLGFQRNPKSRKSFGEFGQQYYYEKVEKSIDDWKNSSEEEKNLKIAELEVKKGEYGLDEFEKELLTALYDSILPF